MCRCQTGCENHFNVISGSLAYDRVGLSLPPGLASPPSPETPSLVFVCVCVYVPGCVCGVGVGYSDFFLLHRQGLSLATRPIYKYVCHFLFTYYYFFFFSFTFYFLIQCLASLWVNFSSVVVSEIY